MVDGQDPVRPSFFRKPGAAGSGAPGRPAPPPPPPPPVAPPPPAPPIPPGPPENPLGPPPETLRRPTFHGVGGTLFGIHVVNTLLTIVTVGIYYFWAKTRLRRYIFSQAEIEGDRFAYHGTGRELLLGTLKAALVFGVPITLLNIIHELLDVPLLKVAVGALSGGLFFVLYPVAMVGARRYRLSRTSWRGIRFSFRGRVWELVKIVLVGTFLAGVTLGLYYPVLLVKRQAFLVSNSYFGSERFDFVGRGRDLFWVYVQAALLTVPTLGLSWVWYVARKRRYFWNHTTFGAARFACTVTGRALLALWAVNALLLVGTVGIGWPWVRVRNVHFAFRNLALVGPLDLATIQQEAQHVSAMGEGLSGFFDSGFDLA